MTWAVNLGYVCGARVFDDVHLCEEACFGVLVNGFKVIWMLINWVLPNWLIILVQKNEPALPWTKQLVNHSKAEN